MLKEKKVYTVAEVAKILGTNVSFIYKLLKSGKMKGIKIGSMKVRNIELDNFLQNYEGYDITDPQNIKELGV